MTSLPPEEQPAQRPLESVPAEAGEQDGEAAAEGACEAAPLDAAQSEEGAEAVLAAADSSLPAKRRGAIGPIWHTVVLVAAILAFSYWGAGRGSPIDIAPVGPVPHAGQEAQKAKAASGKEPAHTSPSTGPVRTDRVRLIRYGLSGIVELILVGWIAFGLRLRKIPFRSLFGSLPKDLNSFTVEAGVAAAFWLCSMLILVAFALSWQVVSDRIYQHEIKSQPASKPGSQAGSQAGAKSPKSPAQQQADTVSKLMELAPATAVEVAAWGALCLLVGFSEELIFRGYLQTQGIALARGVPLGLSLAALIFGAAHGYQGLRGMCLITIYGVLFGCVALLRRSLFPGMLAHSWHDFATGMLLALIRSSHLLDTLRSS